MRLNAELALAVDTQIELLNRRGDCSQRELMLVVDLNAERRRVRELLQQMDAQQAESSASTERAQEEIGQLKGTLSALRSDLDLIRDEAKRWEQERERSGIESRSAQADLCTARVGIRALHAQVKDGESVAKKLRQQAVEIVRADVETETQRMVRSLQDAALLTQKENAFKNKEWKRRTEAVRDELESARREIAALKQRCCVGSVSQETRSAALAVSKDLFTAVLGVVAGDDSAAVAVCACIRRLVLDVLGGSEDEVARLSSACSVVVCGVVDQGEAVGRCRVATMDQLAPFVERVFNAMDLGVVLDMQVMSV